MLRVSGWISQRSYSGTYTTSLRSSVEDYVWEHGRRYHKLDEGGTTSHNSLCYRRSALNAI